MKKLELIGQKCQEAIDEWAAIGTDKDVNSNPIEYGRFELAFELKEILNGEKI